MRTIDLNCDLGEGFGAWKMGDDETMLGIVTSATGSPALDCPLAIGWIDTAVSAPGTAVVLDLGGRSADASVVAMPFLDPERKLSKV